MNKSELILALSERSGISLELARSVVETTIDLMKQQLLEGGRIEIRGFGSFEMREYKAYTGRNPKTGESVSVKPKRTPFFKCGQDLKDILNSD
ncbi:MAG: HU family DNA-binding protein [Desulfovibrio sp.]|nr:integration host factor subunit beta [Mailhella sp.]